MNLLFDYLNLIFGILKIFIYKLFYVKRIKFVGIPKVNFSSTFFIKKGSMFSCDSGLRIRNNTSFRIYDGGKIDIGKHCFINDSCQFSCRKGITIGNNFICGNNVYFYDNDHDYKNDINSYATDGITIGDNVWIGANCVILKGVLIGNNCVIAAGTIINRDIPDNSVVYMKRDLKIISKNKKLN